MRLIMPTGTYKVDVARADRAGLTLSIIPPSKEGTTFRFTHEEARDLDVRTRTGTISEEGLRVLAEEAVSVLFEGGVA